MNSTKKVFIASATETKTQAKIVAHALAEAGHEPLRWWKSFRPGDNTLARLRSIAADVDAAVFMCLGTDKTWYREAITQEPRDNVILELGLFLQPLGPEACIIVSDAKTRLPSDYAGYTYLPWGDDPETVAEKVVEHLRVTFQNRPALRLNDQVLTLEADPHVSRIGLSDTLPVEWRQRALYLGTEGARAWLSVVRDPNYLSDAQQGRIRRQLFECISKIQAASFVSLGPGDGFKDRELAINIRKTISPLTYVPIDISEGIIESAFTAVSSAAFVPFGVISDFEDRMPFIGERLRRRVPSPRLVSMLGNTFGNLDGFEDSFMQNVLNVLGKDDYLLLEVAVSADQDLRTEPFRPNSQGSQLLRRFYANGLARRLQTPIDEILKSYDERLEFVEGHSDVPEALAKNLVDKASKRVVISIRRYRWPAFLKWLQALSFEICHESHFLFEDKGMGSGIVLLRPRG